jgi:tRNA (cmo5U34)-methyltransferase
VPGFQQHWRQRGAEDLRFELRDATSYDGFDNMSLAIASFTVQFIAEREKTTLLQRIYGGLVEGGALFIAEKTVANSSTLQELITFSYYDYKLATFSAEEILDKERRLRGLMTPWTKARLLEVLGAIGFHLQDIESFWQEGPFIAFVAQKRTPFYRARNPRPRLIAA